MNWKEFNLSIGLVIGIITLTLIVSAAMEPSKPFCEHQGYTLDEGNLTKDIMYCVFNDNNKCPSWDFFMGDCGQEYVKEFPCVKEGEFVWTQFEECCEGSIPSHLKHKGFFSKFWTIVGQSKCEPVPNFFSRYLKHSLLFWLVVLVAIILLIILIYKKVKK